MIPKTDEEIALVQLSRKFKSILRGKVLLDHRVFKSRAEDITYTNWLLVNYIEGIDTQAFDYRDADGVKVSLAETDFKKISQTVQELYSLAFARNDELSALIKASADPLSVDISSGWPRVPYELAG
jgi:hypothetical protein